MNNLGVGVPPVNGEVDAAYTADACAKLQPSWHHDWRFSLIGTPGYVPSVWWLRQTEDNFVQGLAEAAKHPNELWLLGNEPLMNDVRPEQAARAVRQWERTLSSWAVRYAVPGVNISLHRLTGALDWLDAYLFERGPIPHAWHVHVYGGVDAFRASIEGFEAWMRRNRVERPVIVSECASTEEPAEVMALLRQWLRSGRLKMAAWFSAYWPEWIEPSLLTAEGNLTEIGELFVAEEHTVHLPVVMG